ncbi:ABC transporter substrate-binding protein [Roseateles asaccharophilus]|uniref:Peptide/nickel transport system substrate-binding protein n=1 Tax=Roseateles asaccharophilus TaxID=582607 RepID=A0ABU2A2N9_9BURK|nr:ABC transporter substrate-binding protein [Roseateles asaccharophilus]MDR7331457.1 peptide/nickel transport system substrate-binding protein [Roseateles asaccharophilus]
MKPLLRLLPLLAALTLIGAHAAPLRWAAQNDILTLDPHSQDHNTSNAIGNHIYEGLTRLGKNYRPEPSLATKWTYTSQTQVRFELRRGVKFHDGSPFTADDVVFSFGRITQPQGTKQTYVSGIKEIRKIDDHTVDVMLEAPTPMLLQNIISFPIMSKVWSEKNKTTSTQDYKAKEENYASRNANGTGPYKLVIWQPDQVVKMVANADWWDKNPSNVTELSYLPIKSPPTRVAALLSGDVDLVTDIPPQDFFKLKEEGKVKLLEGSEIRTVFFVMDQGSDELRESSVKGKNPFKDKRVREAMNLALDREAIKRSIMRGLSVPGALMIAPGVNGYDAALDKPLKADTARAKKLLADAGYPNGFELPLHCPNNRYVNDEQVCQAAVSMWAKIGVRARLVAAPFATHSQTFQRHESPFFMLGWGVSTYDALYGMQAWGHTRTNGADGNFNFGKVSDTRLDELIQKIKFEPDVPQRNALIKEALLRIRDEFLFVPIHHQIRPWAMKKGVETLHRSNDYFEARYTSIK